MTLSEAAPSSGRDALTAWWRALLAPVTPGMDDDSPRARPLAVVIMLALLAGQVWLRYQHQFLWAKWFQGVHILIGLVMFLAVIRVFHGSGVLRRIRARTWIVLFGGAALFTTFWHVGRVDAFRRWFQPLVDSTGTYAPIYGFIYFSVCAFIFRTVLPFGFARLAWGLGPGALGLYAPTNPHPPAVRRIWPLYVLLFLAVFPFVFYVSGLAPFLAKYPMCRAMITADGHIALSHFLVYELFYLLVFVSGEGFWRGFLIFGMEKDLYALPLMIVPYVTAHYGKPYPETMGAIVAGFILGWLALKHRSVWLGVALHYSVAISMDLLAVRGNGLVIDP